MGGGRGNMTPAFFFSSNVFVFANCNKAFLAQVLKGIMMRKFGALALLLSAVAFAGCSGAVGGGDRYATHPVTGKVTYNGAPVPGAVVTFSPNKSGVPGASGITDNQGTYILTTYDAGDGAVEGEYKVMVSKTAPSASGGGGAPAHDPTGASGNTGAPSHAGGGKGAASSGGGSLLPAKYAKATDTPLLKTVAKGDNSIDLVIE